MPLFPINVYNTLSGALEPFSPQVPPEVRMYVCGVTVYDFCHIGHARAYVNFDCMRRVLTHFGYTVQYVQNFTDIDDKIIARAHERGISVSELTNTFIEAYFQDMDQLNILRASAYPKATDFVSQMHDMISGLIEKGAAYVVNGDVWCRVSYLNSYGKLSKKVLDDLIAGKRVQTVLEKEHPLDFALWKSTKPGEPYWDSPWGPGRPGWHIECSAMVLDQLGETLDIHGGGEDLIFPHHENEICQSEIFTGKPLSKYWIHNGFVTIKDEKMSKSKHNFYTIREILDQFSGETLRFFLLKVHYRSPLNFSFEGLREAETALKKLSQAVQQFPPTGAPILHPKLTELVQKFDAALAEDFNFTQAIGVLFEMVHVINSEELPSDALYQCGQILGLFAQPLDEKPPAEALDLAQARIEAKQAKDYALADQLRARILTEFGWVLEDTKAGIRWKKA